MSDIEQIMKSIEARKTLRASQMPDDASALRAMFEAHQRLKEMGWNDAVYCPKDGTVFEAIEAGSTGIHKCHYMGDWPTGNWWVHDAGDLYPSRPILYRLITKEPTTDAGGPETKPESGSKDTKE